MNLFGEKVMLRALEAQDNLLLHELINDADIEKMLGGRSFPVSMHHQDNWFNKQEIETDILRCAIVPKDDVDNAVGTIILSDIDYMNGVAQLHIKLVSRSQGKGYGYDSIKTLVKYAFEELRLHCIYAEVLSYNTPSCKLFEKCNFTRDGVLRNRLFKNGAHRDICVYSILQTDNRD